METATTTTTLAEAAVIALAQGMTGKLDGRAGEGFNALRTVIQSRLTGDWRAERVLADVVEHPLDERRRQALAHELSYYAEVDPDFWSCVEIIIRNIQSA